MEESKVPIANNPVSQSERFHLIDMLRGVALFGILLMNIPYFAMPNYFKESFLSNPYSVNLWVYSGISVFFEGKMRALFGMLFGAGLLLFTRKKEKSGQSVHFLY